MKKHLLTLIICLFAGSLFAEHPARWVRYPAISPDGNTILFGYMGNIYKISSKGGTAVPITTGNDYNMRPVWSHDGKTIAYAGNHSGNFDVYSMPSTGGIPTRLTYNSANDYPYDFTTDNKEILFGSGREAPAKSIRFPETGYFQNLYTIPAEGGRPLLVTAAGAEDAHYNSTGKEIIFQDKKGYEDSYRKHERAAITRDIWIYDIAADKYEKITNFNGEDREPVFGTDDNTVYYLNDKDGTLNIYKKDIAAGTEKQITKFRDFPVRNLSISEDGTLAFAWKGDIYTIKDGGQPQKLNAEVTDNAGYQPVRNIPISNMSEFEASPDGKEIAFVNRGEVFVTGVSDSRTKRITNTPEQERMITWSPDGKYLLYSAERNGSWNIYKVSLKYPDEKYFYASTILKTEPVVENASDDYQPEYSPDGKKLAYVSERNILKVMNVKSGKTVTVLPEGQNHSYSDGDWGFRWSPDSKWLLVDDEKGYMFTQNTALIKADGSGEIRYPVNGGFGEFDAQWAMGGKMMTYLSSRDGLKSLAVQGSSEDDIFAVFFDQKAYDKYMLSKEDYTLMNEKASSEKKDKKKDEEKDEEKDKKDGKKDKKEKVKNLKLNLDNIDNRKIKLTINSCHISDYVLNKDASKVYYLASGEKGYDLWETTPRTHETKILANLQGSPSGIELSKDGSSIFLSNRGRLVKVSTASGQVTPVQIDGTMELNAAAERQYIFDHVWKQVTKKFYDPGRLGERWKMYHDEYEKFLPYINNNYDFQVLLSELLGELNASHTGGRFYPYKANGDKTASIGALYDEKYSGPGIKISCIIPGGPLDNAENKIKAGDIITAINGHQIQAGENWNKYLNNINDVNTLLSIKAKHKEFTQTIRPVSMGSEKRLMYKRWTKTMSHMVDSLSGGKLGYVHIEGMDDYSFRHVFDKVMGKNISREALVVDTRFNGGGWLHDDLNTFLSGKLYLRFAPQGNVVKGGEPLTRWYKPSIVLISEGNYSDAFIFPFIYQQNHIGKLVGMPVAGTGTAVWWEQQINPQIIFGIPMVATIGTDGKETENKELEPDIKVTLPYNDCLNGRDPQLEAAVKELLKEAKQNK
ncbi:MAG: S41 family peptidase [Bacteroidales bacterium]|jgi:Tol biopolymer transport system component/C-terminal processing protease CtpA/Prc|nr:S41 family peptidase [Bacteroidales bacterium]